MFIKFKNHMDVIRASVIVLTLFTTVVFPQYPESSAINQIDSQYVTQFFAAPDIYYTGHEVNQGGDINGDSFDDFLIGSNGPNNTSGAYVVFGSESLNVADVSLADLNGSNGFAIESPESNDLMGFSIDSAGDFNQDGIDDIIIGAFQSDIGAVDAGRAYILFGSDQGFSSTFDLADLDGTNGLIIKGVAVNDQLGFDVSTAGDVNDDGINDVVVSAYTASNNGEGSGSIYIIYGSLKEFPAVIDLSLLNSSQGFRVDGAAAEDHFGGSVSSAGDFNGDGIDDLVVGAILSDINGDRSGASYVIFGAANIPAALQVSDLNGNNGIIIKGSNSLQRIGYTVKGAGDFNGDGIDDVMIGSPSTFSEGRRGGVFVIFGQNSFVQTTYNINFSDGLTGSLVRGVLNESTLFGFSFAAGFDLNADGINDYAFGAPFQDAENSNSNGVVYVLYGASNLSNQTIIDVGDIDGENGFLIYGEFSGDELGISISAVGDIDNNGLDDIVFGARGFSDTNSGSAYILHGNDTLFKSGF